MQKTLNKSIAVVIFSSIAHMQAMEVAKQSKEHISNYIGAHAYTMQFDFQEQLRKNDLFIKQLAESIGKKQKANAFFVNGWGQFFGALIALEAYGENQDDGKFFNVIKENLQSAVNKCKNNVDSFVNVNIREYTKNIMMYPHQGKYLDFKPVNIQEPITHLNQYIKEDSAFRFALYEGKLYLKIEMQTEGTIFKKLWEMTNFSELLEQNHYVNLEQNKEIPHITLINSNDIAKIKEFFTKNHATQADQWYETYMASLIAVLNNISITEENALKFTELSSTYSEDYAPFEEVIVARLKAPFITEALNVFADKIKNDTGVIIPGKKEPSFHVTIATKYRQPSVLPYKSIDEIVNSIKNNVPWLDLSFIKK